METYAPTKLDDWGGAWTITNIWKTGTNNYVNYFQLFFSNNQTLLGYSENTKSFAQESLVYTPTSIDYRIEAAGNNINQLTKILGTQKKELKIAEKNLKKAKTNKEKQGKQKIVNNISQNISNNIIPAIARGNKELQDLLALKPQILANPKIIATNSHATHSVTQSGSTGNQIELYRFTLQTDLPPVSVVDRIVFEVHSSSSSVSFVDGSLRLVEKSSLKPVLNCAQKQTTKTIIDCLPNQCVTQDRDCNPVLRDNNPHEYILVGKLQNTTTGSYAINKIDGIMYNALNAGAFNISITNNTRPFQTIFTAGQ